MQTNDHQTKDYSAELDRKFGAIGTKERELFDEEAWNFYTGQLLLDALGLHVDIVRPIV